MRRISGALSILAAGSLLFAGAASANAQQKAITAADCGNGVSINAEPFTILQNGATGHFNVVATGLGNGTMDVIGHSPTGTSKDWTGFSATSAGGATTGTLDFFLGPTQPQMTIEVNVYAGGHILSCTKSRQINFGDK